MYTVAVKRDFIARHYLTGGDWGEENKPHAHHYFIEVRMEGDALDEHGYLADICDIETVLDARIAYFRDRVLNELPEFDGLNPSIEHFARILCLSMAADIRIQRLSAIAVKLWENESAWAQFRQTFQSA